MAAVCGPPADRGNKREAQSTRVTAIPQILDRENHGQVPCSFLPETTDIFSDHADWIVFSG